VQQRYKDAEARAAEWNRKHNLLKEEVNVNWDDIDKTYPVQLGKDINKRVCSNKGRHVALDQQGIGSLLQTYDYRVDLQQS